MCNDKENKELPICTDGYEKDGKIFCNIKAEFCINPVKCNMYIANVDDKSKAVNKVEKYVPIKYLDGGDDEWWKQEDPILKPPPDGKCWEAITTTEFGPDAFALSNKILVHVSTNDGNMDGVEDPSLTNFSYFAPSLEAALRFAGGSMPLSESVFHQEKVVYLKKKDATEAVKI